MGTDQRVAAERIRVLIAEDDPKLAFAMRVQLEIERGFEIIGTVGDAQSTIEAALQERPDVTLLDCGLQDLDGVEIARRILEAWPAAVIVAHGGDERALRRAAGAGVARSVRKTDMNDDLARVVRDVVARNRRR